jgi:hypothetical protein
MNEYKISASYYQNINEWELSIKSNRDQDDHIHFERTTITGIDTKEAAKNFFAALLKNGGSIIRTKYDEEFGIGIKYGRQIYTGVIVWEDKKNAWCYEPYHFFK